MWKVLPVLLTAHPRRLASRHNLRHVPFATALPPEARSQDAHLYVITAWPSTILMSLMSGGSRSFSRFSGDAISLSTAEFNTDCGNGKDPSIPLIGSNRM